MADSSAAASRLIGMAGFMNHVLTHTATRCRRFAADRYGGPHEPCADAHGYPLPPLRG